MGKAISTTGFKRGKKILEQNMGTEKISAREPEAQSNYYLLINTSSTKVKRYEKNLALVLDRLQKNSIYGSPKLDSTLSQNV